MKSLSLIIAVVLGVVLTGCAITENKLVRDQGRVSFASTQMQLDRETMTKLIKWLQQNPPKVPMFEMKAHEGRPITIDAKEFTLYQHTDPVELARVVFNSPAFKRDWGALFPDEKGWFHALDRVLTFGERTIGSTVPWLAGAYAIGELGGGRDVNFSNDGDAAIVKGDGNFSNDVQKATGKNNVTGGASETDKNNIKTTNTTTQTCAELDGGCTN